MPSTGEAPKEGAEGVLHADLLPPEQPLVECADSGPTSSCWVGRFPFPAQFGSPVCAALLGWALEAEMLWGSRLLFGHPKLSLCKQVLSRSVLEPVYARHRRKEP